MSNHKQDRMNKKREKKAAKKARQRANRAASVAQENNEAAVAVAEPEQVKVIVRPSAELKGICKCFGLEFKGAIVAFLNNRLEDCRDFLVAAKAERKAANKMIADPKLKIKRTKIDELEAAIVEAEREAEKEAKQARIKKQDLRLAQATIKNLLLCLPESRKLSSRTLEVLSMRGRDEASLYLETVRQNLSEILTVASVLDSSRSTLAEKLAELNTRIAALHAKINLFEVNLVWSDRRKRPGGDGLTLDVIAIRRGAPARVKALAKQIKGKKAPITKLAEPVVVEAVRMAG